MTDLNLVPFAVLGALLALIVIALLVYRQKLAHQADETLDVLEAADVANRQVAVAQKLNQIDRWGKTLTVLTVLYGIAIGLVFAYQQWVAQTNLVK